MAINKALSGEDFIAPAYDLAAFNCPHCGSYNEQTWYHSATLFRTDTWQGAAERENIFSFALCRRCSNYIIWFGGRDGNMVYPGASLAPRPHTDMPEELASDYDEARSIVSSSPRGAAALLRLATERLVGILVEKRTGKAGLRQSKQANRHIGEVGATGDSPEGVGFTKSYWK